MWQRFNGAATWRSRIGGDPRPRRCEGGKLQWGRDLAVADSPLVLVSPRRAYLLQWGRDLAVADSRTRAGPLAAASGFNGAATWRSRIVLTVPACRRCAGPCFNGAATWRSRIVEQMAVHLRATDPLQWGRDLAVADRAIICLGV